MAKEATVEVDKELYDGLQQARKKKPRYFAVIAKGTDVVGMIVQKKAINDGLAQKKKSECKGTLVIKGICIGEGVELKLEVLDAEPSLAAKKVKDFISETTDLTLKASWSVVTKLSEVPDDEAKPAAGPTAAPTAQDPLAAFQTKSQAVYAGLAKLKETNPFRDGLNARLQMEIALVGNVPANVPKGLASLDMLEQESKTAETYSTRATDVFFLIEKLSEQDPLRGQLMYSWNAEITSARNAGATPAQYVPAALQRLATLEQMVKAKLPAETAQPEAKKEAAKEPTPESPKAEPAKEPAAKVDVKALQERLKGLLTRQKALFALDATWREKMLPFSQPATSSVMSGSPTATAALDNLEKALDAAEGNDALPTEAKQQEAPPPKANVSASDLAADWKKKVADWTPIIKEAIGANGPMAADIKKALAQASSLSKPGGDMAQALERLTECHDLAVLATRTGDSQHKKWMAELARVEPKYLEALQSNSADATKLRAVMGYCAEQAENEAYDKALAGLKRLEGLLNPPADKGAETKAPETKEPEAKEPSAESSEDKPGESTETEAQEAAKELSADDLRKQLAELRIELEKRVGDAEPDQLSEVTALQEKAAPLDKEASTNIEADKLVDAAASIEALRKLLDGKSAAEPAASDSGKFDALKARLEPELLKAQKANPDAATSLGNTWNYAVEQADEGNDDKATAAFQRLEKAIAEALAGAPKTDAEKFGIAEGLVAERRKQLEKFFAARLATAEASTEGAVSSVEKAISETVPDEDPKFLAAAVQSALDEKYEEVLAALEKPLASKDSTPEEITALVEKLRAELAGDELLEALARAKSELGVEADVKADFDSLLDDVLDKVNDKAAA